MLDYMTGRQERITQLLAKLPHVTRGESQELNRLLRAEDKEYENAVARINTLLQPYLDSLHI